MLEKIDHFLQALKFHGMKEAFQEMRQEGILKEDKLTTIEALLRAEFNQRQVRSLNYRLKLAHLPYIKCLTDFDWASSFLSEEKVCCLQTGAFIANHANILLVGGAGSGKSHVAIALAYSCIQQGHRTRFYDFYHLASQLLQAHQQGQKDRFISWLQRFSLVVVDQVGYLPIDPQAASLLCEFFLGCYEKTPLILTTHLTFEEWGAVFGHPKLAMAVIDRLTHHCHILETGNTSWRLKSSSRTSS